MTHPAYPCSPEAVKGIQMHWAVACYVYLFLKFVLADNIPLDICLIRTLYSLLGYVRSVLINCLVLFLKLKALFVSCVYVNAFYKLWFKYSPESLSRRAGREINCLSGAGPQVILSIENCHVSLFGNGLTNGLTC